MDLDELRAFVAVVEKGSLVAAASSLRFARATLRRRIDELEARAGVRLLNRSDRGVTPTEAGVLLAERARLILKDATGLLEAVREVAADPQGSLHVVVPVGLPPQATAALLKLVNQMLPRLRLHLTLAIDPLAALGDDVDLAFYFGARAATGRWRSLDVVTIEQQLMASPKWLEVHGVPKTLEALAHVPLLRWEEPGVDSNTLPLRDGSSLSLRPHVVSPDIYLLRQCALDSMGVAFVPEGSTIPSIGAEPLVPVLPDLVGRALPVRIAVPASHSELPRVRALFDLLQRFLSVRV
jgi:DNA-binding transcriptional LysR family regulator